MDATGNIVFINGPAFKAKNRVKQLRYMGR